MAPDKNERDERREQFDDTVDKAKQGAQKLAGWLGRKLTRAADELSQVEPVRRKLDELSERREDWAEQRELGRVGAVYGEAIDRYLQAIGNIEGRIGRLEAARLALHENIQALRLRSVPEDNEELRGYQQQVAEIRADKDALHEHLTPLRNAVEQLDRQRRAAQVRLEADAASVDELVAEAERNVASVDSQVDAAIDAAGGPPPQT